MSDSSENAALLAVQEITAQELRTLLNSPEPPLVVDVREPVELLSGVIPGSVSVPLGAIAQRMGELPRDRPIVAYCQTGERSLMIVQFLNRRGWRNAKSLRGGIEAWNQLGSPASG